MKMKKYSKRIMGLYIFIVAFLFFHPSSVFALDVTIKRGESFDYPGTGEVYINIIPDKEMKNEITIRLTEKEAKAAVKDGKIKISDFVTNDCMETLSAGFELSRYGINVEYDGDDDQIALRMSMDGQNTAVDRSKVKFKISKIQILEIPAKNRDPKVVKSTYTDLQAAFGIANTARLTNGKSITIKPSPASVGYRYRFYMEPDGFTDKGFKEKCPSMTDFTIFADYDYYGSAKNTVVDYKVPLTESPVTLGEIKCDGSKTYPENSFEALFCKDWKVAGGDKPDANKIQFTKDQNTYAKKFGAGKAEVFSCDPFTLVKSPKISDDDYYKEKNTSYRIGTTTLTLSGGQYKYNYGGQDKDGIGQIVKRETASCDVTCNEVVTTKYGPPVASKAGLCFEYKVEVISRVNCFMTKEPNLPKYTKKVGGELVVKAAYCTPSPGCNHGNGFTDAAAGPNEDFDACIDQCDGGKYTSKCSNKCYKQVYKKAATSRKTTGLDFDDIVTQIGNTLDRDKSRDGEGRYLNILVDGKRKIIWKPENRLARWYVENGYVTAQPCLKTEAEGGGISAVCGCWAECQWNGCQKGTIDLGDGDKIKYTNGEVYLNPQQVNGTGAYAGKVYKTTYDNGTVAETGEVDRDVKYNIQVYQDTVKLCQSYSKCSETKAEFSISVDYKTGNETKTINFPYTAKNDAKAVDSIQRSRETGRVNCTSANANSIILQSGGCYACSSGTASTKVDDNINKASSSKWYETEWGFPGTWINNKTGEINYDSTGKSSGWTKQENKFCLPFNAKNVNAKWWNYYQTKLFGPNSPEAARYSYNDSAYLNSIKECATNVGDIVKAQQENALKFKANDVEEWNILAKTRKFGLFEWNIDIKCFYAINDNYLIDKDTPDTVKDALQCVGGAKEKMRVRSAELTNLFPEAGGNTLSNAETTGRTPGFNWSEFASNEKTEDYFSKPSEYVKWVQSKGYTVYSDDYLDYEVTLTKEKINELKKQDHNYTKFEGEIETNAVLNYSSSLLRKDLKDFAKVPTAEALKCNNMKNYQSNECAEAGKGGAE